MSESSETCNIGYFKSKQYEDQNEIVFDKDLGNDVENPLVYVFNNRWTVSIFINFPFL